MKLVRYGPAGKEKPGIIDKNGAWFSYQGERIGQGRDQACDFLRQNGRLVADLEERVRLHFGLVPEARPNPDSSPELREAAAAEEHAKGEAEGGANGGIKRHKTKAPAAARN